MLTQNFKTLSSLPPLTCKHMGLAIWSVQEHPVNSFLTYSHSDCFVRGLSLTSTLAFRL